MRNPIDYAKYIVNRLKRRKARKEEDQKYIHYVCEQTGWTPEHAKEEMEKAKEEGISYKYYVKRGAWARTDKEMEKMKRDMKYVSERNKEDHDHAVEVVCEATGWSESKARSEMIKAGRNCGCSFKDYYKFRLYQYTPEQQQEFLTLKVCEQLGFKYNTNQESLQLILYKGRFAKKYSDLLGREWFMSKNISYKTFLKKIDGVEDLIIKPNSSTQGKGVEKIHCGSGVEDKRQVYDYIKAMPYNMICEECIAQHPDIAAFNPSSVNTIRVMTVMDKGECHHIYAGFRMGQGNVVDNFHAGGIISTVDVKTGITCMDAIDLNGTHYPVHPISKLPTKGFQIPHWDEVLRVTEEAARRLEGAGVVGWDVAVTQDGVCLIEGNSQMSYHIIQLPYVEDGIGMRKVFAPFLEN